MLMLWARLASYSLVVIFTVSGILSKMPEVKDIEIAPADNHTVSMQFTIIEKPEPIPEEKSIEDEPLVEKEEKIEEVEKKQPPRPAVKPKPAQKKQVQKKAVKKTPPKKSTAKRSKKAAKPKIRKSVRPTYPASAKKKGIQGTVYIRVQVNSQGRVTLARIHRSSGYSQLDKAGLSAAKRFLFTKGNSASVTIPFRFYIKGK